MAEQSRSPQGQEEKEEETEIPRPLCGHSPNDLKPPTRPCLLKFPLPPDRAKLATKSQTPGPLGDTNAIGKGKCLGVGVGELGSFCLPHLSYLQTLSLN